MPTVSSSTTQQHLSMNNDRISNNHSTMNSQPSQSRRRAQTPSPLPRSTITLSQTTILLAHFANFKLSADRIVNSTLSVTLTPPTLQLPQPARRRQPRRRRRRNVTVNKLSDADLEAELAARRAARAKERDRYARAIRSEKLSVLESELNRLRQELVRVGRGNSVGNSLHGTPPTARWESLPDRRRSATSNLPIPGTPLPPTPGPPPPPPPGPPGPPGDDAPFTDPETRRREKEERQRRREAKRKEREANRKPLTLAEIIKSAGPDPMKRLKPPGSIAVPDVHAPEETPQDNEELKDVREGLKKVSSSQADEEKKSDEGKKDGDENKEAAEVNEAAKKDEGEEKAEDKGENKEADEPNTEDKEAVDGKEKAEGKDSEEKTTEKKEDKKEESTEQEESAEPDTKNENLNPANAQSEEVDSKPQEGEDDSTQTKDTPKSPKPEPTTSENKQDHEQAVSEEKPVSNESPTKINTPPTENTTKSPPKPPSQASESANKELKLPNGLDALAALSNLKAKLPAKPAATDDAGANGDQSAAGSASDGPAPRPKTPARLSIEEKRRLRRAKKEDGVKME